MTKTNVQSTPSNSQHHDTPNNKTHVIKFRVTAEEKMSLELTCKLLNLSLSTFIRRAIHNVKIEKTVIVAGGGEKSLTAISTLLAQFSKVGGNLNQLARHFNSGGADTEQIRAKLLHLSLSTLIRRALHNAKIEHTVVVAGGGEETLTAVSTLLAQCSKVGINLNQLARHFNSGGADTEQIRAKILDELADLTAFRLHAEKVLGELYGNAQAYQL